MAIYVPERKIWDRQPHQTGVDWSNPITAGLEFAFNPKSGFVDQVSGKTLTTTGKVDVRPALNLVGAYASASSDVLTCTLSKPIPTTGAVSVFQLISVDNSTTTRKSSLRLAGATGTVLSHEYSPAGNTLDQAAVQDALSTFYLNSFPSYAANQLYTYYIEHVASSASLTYERNGVSATNTNGNGTRKEAITSVFIGNNTSTMPLTGNINLVLVFSRSLTTQERKSLSENPWQIFKPAKRWFSITQVTNVQLLSPSADISFGNWTPSTGSTLYGVIDEATANYTDYIQASTASSCEVKFNSGADPVSSTGHKLRYRLLAGTGVLDVSLKCGATTIATWTEFLGVAAQDIEHVLNTTQTDSITDYSDLRVTFTSR